MEYIFRNDLPANSVVVAECSVTIGVAAAGAKSLAALDTSERRRAIWDALVDEFQEYPGLMLALAQVESILVVPLEAYQTGFGRSEVLLKIALLKPGEGEVGPAEVETLVGGEWYGLPGIEVSQKHTDFIRLVCQTYDDIPMGLIGLLRLRIGGRESLCVEKVEYRSGSNGRTIILVVRLA